MATVRLGSRQFAIVAAPSILLGVVAVWIRWHGFELAIATSIPPLLAALPNTWTILLGMLAGGGAGLLAGLIGIGGGIVVVPVVYYGVVASGLSADQAAHIAVGTSLAAILPTAAVSSFCHWRAGHTDFAFLRTWGPGIIIGVIAAQLAAPHLPGDLMTGLFGLLCLGFALRFAFPGQFKRHGRQAPRPRLRTIASVSIGLFSGLAGVGGGIMTNIVMSLSGLPMHKCVGRAAAVGVVVSVPATIVAAFGPGPHGATQIGSIDLVVLACIAPTQAATAWLGARLARRVPGDRLSRIMAIALFATGTVMLHSSLVRS
jgi:uncharacterized membrane protein YfcA